MYHPARGAANFAWLDLPEPVGYCGTVQTDPVPGALVPAVAAAPKAKPRELRNTTTMVERPGWILRLLGRIFFRKVAFDDGEVSRLNELNETGVIVYVMGSQSLLDYLYFNWAFLKKGLPRAIFGKGMRMWPFRSVLVLLKTFFRWIFRWPRKMRPTEDEIIREAPAQGRSLVLFLRKARTILPWWGEFKEDPLKDVVAAQQALERPIYLVPVLLVWERAPSRLKRSLVDLIFGDPDAPGRVRKVLNFIRNYRFALVKVGEHIDLRAYLAERIGSPDPALVGRDLRWALNHRFHLENKVIKGPVLKRAAEIKDELLRLEPFQRKLHALATEEGRPFDAIRKEAGAYLKEIVADWKIGYIEFQLLLLTYVFSRIYAGIELEGLPSVRDAAKRAPLVILPSHKSHIDYLLISYLFYGYGLVPPHIAAGNNLNFWPLGHIFRRGGAFFLRRSFNQNKVYSTTFETYVHKLLKEGYSLEFFIEGGRSRTGKLLKPKYGLLGHCVDAVVEGNTHDLNMCPAAIGYEKIIEGASYSRELSGAEKEKENLGELFRATRVLRTRYGRVHLRFAEPFSLREFITAHGVDVDTGFKDEAERRHVIKRLAYRVLDRINREMVATPSAVVATALLGNPRRGIGRHALIRRVGAILDFLTRRNAPLSSTLATILAANRALLAELRQQSPDDPALGALDGAGEASARIGDIAAPVVDETTQMFVQNKWLVRTTYEDEVVFQIPPERRLELDFYKNNVVHHLACESLLAATLLRCGAEDDLWGDRLRKETLFISDLLKLEYVFAYGQTFDENYRTTLDAFAEAKLLESDRAAKIALSRTGERTLRLLANLTLPVIEGYYIVARGAAALKEPLPEKDFFVLLQKLGDQLWREGEITFKESVSSVTFDNAVARLQESRLLGRKYLSVGRKSGRCVEMGPAAGEDPSALPAMADRLRRFLLRGY